MERYIYRPCNALYIIRRLDTDVVEYRESAEFHQCVDEATVTIKGMQVEMKATVLLLLVAALVGCAGASKRDAVQAAPRNEAFVVHSATLGETRTINVHVPPYYGNASAKGGAAFPVLYMPDGGIDEDFPHVVATVDSLIKERAIRPVIVVGIPNTQRRRDLTGPTTIASDSAIAKTVGESAAFRRFIKEELVPEINRRYRTTSERAIMGESLAGLFVIETLLVDPALFTHYIAFDPSLWWNQGALVEAAPRQLLAFNNSRQTLYVAKSRDDIDDRIAQFATLVQPATPVGLRWRYDPRPDLTHATIFRAVERDALLDAFSRVNR